EYKVRVAPLVLIIKNLITFRNTFVANVDGRTRQHMLHFCGRFAAERALEFSLSRFFILTQGS
ncbi:MAG: hypothetical protein QNI91_18050, partial [Arenicellales bacterium]|nr:hypothetical protein [Arenicellales bacterium]